jgi:hypothetical protein
MRPLQSTRKFILGCLFNDALSYWNYRVFNVKLINEKWIVTDEVGYGHGLILGTIPTLQSRESLVGIPSTLEARRTMNLGSIPGRGKIFSSP